MIIAYISILTSSLQDIRIVSISILGSALICTLFVERIGVLSLVLLFPSLTLVTLFLTMRQSPITWIINFLLSPRRFICVFCWFIVGICCLTLAFLGHLQQWERTQSRKVFHLASSVVFSIGILVDIDLLTISAASLFGILSLVEAMRLQNLSVIGSYLVESLFALFSNNEDRTKLEISPLTLLAGLSYPLIFPSAQRLQKYQPNYTSDWFLGRSRAALFTGVMSTGIGDSFAALVGSKYGRNHWPNNERTVEGSLAGLISQLVFCAIVLWPAGVFSAIQSQLRGILSILLLLAGTFCSSMIETVLSDEYDDNIVVPVCIYPLLKLC